MPGSCGHDRVRRMTSVESLGDSSLVRRIAAAPHLQAADEARARVNDWRAEIAGVSAGKTLTRLAAAHPRLDALITGLAGGAPPLLGLLRDSPGRVVALLVTAPGSPVWGILAHPQNASAATREEAEAERPLRPRKAEAALLIALADIGDVWPVTQVVERQTTLADAAVGAAVDYLLVDAQRRGKLKVSESGRPGQGSGY